MEEPGRSFPAEGPSGLQTAHRGVVNRQGQGEEWRISFWGYRPQHLPIVSSEEVDINIYDEFGKKDIALSYEVVIWFVITDPYSRIAVYRKTA